MPLLLKLPCTKKFRSINEVPDGYGVMGVFDAAMLNARKGDLHLHEEEVHGPCLHVGMSQEPTCVHTAQ